MDSPKISVVMTVFNTYHFLPRALACLMGQEYHHWELLLISDGPAPTNRYAPRQILRPLKTRFPNHRIESWESPRRPGCWGNPAREFGLNQCAGDYVCWVNHDNLIAPGYLAAHAANIARRPGCVSVVDIELWKEARYVGRFPRGYITGKIDLLCYCLPVTTARQIQAFGPELAELYAADGQVFERSAKQLPVEHNRIVVGTHF